MVRLENSLDPSNEDFGLLRYLVFLVFGYSAMHGYSLFVHLANQTRLPVDFLLNAMGTNQTADVIH